MELAIYQPQPSPFDFPTKAPPAYSTTHPSNHQLAPPPPAYTPTISNINAEARPQSLTIHATRVLPPVAFPAQPSLETDFNISEADWALFTEDLQRAAAPTAGQKTLAVLGGVGTAGVIWEPRTASLVARWVWQAYTVRNIKKALEEGTEGGIGAVLKTWNGKWRAIGVKVRVEVPELGKKAAKDCDALHATNHHSLGVVRCGQNAAEGSSDVVQDETRIVENVRILAAGRRDAVPETKPRDSGSWLRGWEADCSVVNVEEKQSKDSKW